MTNETRKILEDIFSGKTPIDSNGKKYYVKTKDFSNDIEFVPENEFVNQKSNLNQPQMDLGANNGFNKQILGQQSGNMGVFDANQSPNNVFFDEGNYQETMTLEEKLNYIKKFIATEEGEDIKYPYVDNKGNITVGTGTNVNDKNMFMSQDWIVDDRTATLEEKEKYYTQLSKTGEHNYNADIFEDKTPLRLAQKDIDKLFDSHVKNDYQKLQDGIDNFDNFPLELQTALMDIRYNTGAVTPDKWPNLHIALEERDLQSIIENVGRKGLHKRNKIVRDLLRQIKSLDY